MNVQEGTRAPTVTMMHFTPNEFFRAQTSMPAVYQQQTPPAVCATPKRPPKLMSQLVDPPKKGRRGSRPEMNGQPVKGHHQGVQQKQQYNRQQHSIETAMDTTIFATPRHITIQHQHIRRENSASIIIPSRRTLSATFMRYTPPATFAEGNGNEISPFFAASKFTESPSAKSLPLPPAEWLMPRNNISKQKIDEVPTTSRGIERSISDGNAPSSADEMGENFVAGNWSPTSSSSNFGTNSPPGIRIHPLQLIASAVITP